MAHLAATNSSLGHFPTGERWTFDQSVTEVFDDMLRRVPDLQKIREAIGFSPRLGLDEIIRSVIEDPRD